MHLFFPSEPPTPLSILITASILFFISPRIIFYSSCIVVFPYPSSLLLAIEHGTNYLFIIVAAVFVASLLTVTGLNVAPHPPPPLCNPLSLS